MNHLMCWNFDECRLRWFASKSIRIATVISVLLFPVLAFLIDKHKLLHFSCIGLFDEILSQIIKISNLFRKSGLLQFLVLSIFTALIAVTIKELYGRGTLPLVKFSPMIKLLKKIVLVKVRKTISMTISEVSEAFCKLFRFNPLLFHFLITATIVIVVFGTRAKSVITVKI